MIVWSGWRIDKEEMLFFWLSTYWRVQLRTSDKSMGYADYERWSRYLFRNWASNLAPSFLSTTKFRISLECYLLIFLEDRISMIGGSREGTVFDA